MASQPPQNVGHSIGNSTYDAALRRNLSTPAFTTSRYLSTDFTDSDGIWVGHGKRQGSRFKDVIYVTCSDTCPALDSLNICLFQISVPVTCTSMSLRLGNKTVVYILHQQNRLDHYRQVPVPTLDLRVMVLWDLHAGAEPDVSR